MRPTIKCAWCGLVLPLTGNGKRPQQHKNGKTTCVGSGQLVQTHEAIRAVNKAPSKAQQSLP